jgi:hypothetical protein
MADLTRAELLDLLRRECAKAGGQKPWAAWAGISEPILSDTLNGRRDPGRTILRALGYTKITTVAYRKLPRSKR